MVRGGAIVCLLGVLMIIPVGAAEIVDAEIMGTLDRDPSRTHEDPVYCLLNPWDPECWQEICNLAPPLCKPTVRIEVIDEVA